MPYQVVLGYFAPINLANKFGPILYLMDTFYGKWRRGNHIRNQKNKYNKPNVKINIMDEGYFYIMRALQL
jgi:hypothetical protein